MINELNELLKQQAEINKKVDEEFAIVLSTCEFSFSTDHCTHEKNRYGICFVKSCPLLDQ